MKNDEAVTGELPGQLALFEDPSTPDAQADEEVCDECGTCCTSSKECVEISGLYEE